MIDTIDEIHVNDECFVDLPEYRITGIMEINLNVPRNKEDQWVPDLTSIMSGMNNDQMIDLFERLEKNGITETDPSVADMINDAKNPHYIPVHRHWLTFTQFALIGFILFVMFVCFCCLYIKLRRSNRRSNSSNRRDERFPERHRD